MESPVISENRSRLPDWSHWSLAHRIGRTPTVGLKNRDFTDDTWIGRPTIPDKRSNFLCTNIPKVIITCHHFTRTFVGEIFLQYRKLLAEELWRGTRLKIIIQIYCKVESCNKI